MSRGGVTDGLKKLQQQGGGGELLLQQLTSEHAFEEAVRGWTTLVVLFTGAFCKRCPQVVREMEDYAERHELIKFAEVDIERVPTVAKHYKVDEVPATITFHLGKAMLKHQGVKLSLIKSHLEELATKTLAYETKASAAALATHHRRDAESSSSSSSSSSASTSSDDDDNDRHDSSHHRSRHSSDRRRHDPSSSSDDDDDDRHHRSTSRR